jgi:pimeloyl-ACP methyl ester carboxylesterase
MATIVLVHGTTAGGWVWKNVRPPLEAAGHTVYTPTLTGLGERVHLASREVDLDTHITDIVNVLAYEALEDVVLVGHSYGGMVITGVADRAPERVGYLVYLDALVPHDGESLLDLGTPEAAEATRARVEAEGDGWLIPLSRGPNDLPDKNVPHPFATWAQPLRLKGDPLSRLPKAYIRCTADKGPGSPFSGTMAISWQRAHGEGGRIIEIDTVHQILPDPDSKAQAILALFPEA